MLKLAHRRNWRWTWVQSEQMLINIADQGGTQSPWATQGVLLQAAAPRLEGSTAFLCTAISRNQICILICKYLHLFLPSRSSILPRVTILEAWWLGKIFSFHMANTSSIPEKLISLLPRLIWLWRGLKVPVHKQMGFRKKLHSCDKPAVWLTEQSQALQGIWCAQDSKCSMGRVSPLCSPAVVEIKHAQQSKHSSWSSYWKF